MLCEVVNVTPMKRSDVDINNMPVKHTQAVGSLFIKSDSTCAECVQTGGPAHTGVNVTPGASQGGFNPSRMCVRIKSILEGRGVRTYLTFYQENL